MKLLFFRIYSSLFFAIICLYLAPELLAAPNCKIAATAMTEAGRIRGLKKRKKVPCYMRTKKEVEKYLRETIDKEVPAERLASEEILYKMIGLIPQEFDYLNGLIELYTSQVAGYYDREKDYYAMAAWLPEFMQLPIAIHELTHALQDQHFPLDTLIDNSSATTDTLLARSALVEGDATAVMIDYTNNLAGADPLAKQDSVSGILLQNIGGALLSPSLASAPHGLRTMILFPYISGLRFAHELLKIGGYPELDKAYANPPNTTEQILHPETYIKSSTKLLELKAPLPFASKEKDLKAEHEDTFGEFFIATLLGTWLNPREASKAAMGWAGDRIALYPRGVNGKRSAVWLTEWDSEKDAEKFRIALEKAYSSRFSSKPRSEGGRRFLEAVTSTKDRVSVEIRSNKKQILLEFSMD